MKLYNTVNDTPNKEYVIILLNQSLADLTCFKTQVKYAHWNVRGIHFYPLHLLFDEIAEETEGFIDKVAERITALGGVANGLLDQAYDNQSLPIYNKDAVNGKEHLHSLIECLGALANSVREYSILCESYNDLDTNDLYIEISRLLDKRLWFLEAHVEL
jgi:starvation-inducible DNA-binding protein